MKNFKILSAFMATLMAGTLLLSACAPTAQQTKPAEPAPQAEAPKPTPEEERAAAEKAAAEAAAKEAAAKAAAEKAAKTPMISSISPTKGRQGSKITVNGEKFGASPVARFDATQAKILEKSPTKLVVVVPSGLSIGKHTVTVESEGYVSNGVEYIDP